MSINHCKGTDAYIVLSLRRFQWLKYLSVVQFEAKFVVGTEKLSRSRPLTRIPNADVSSKTYSNLSLISDCSTSPAVYTVTVFTVALFDPFCGISTSLLCLSHSWVSAVEVLQSTKPDTLLVLDQPSSFTLLLKHSFSFKDLFNTFVIYRRLSFYALFFSSKRKIPTDYPQCPAIPYT